MKISTLIGLSLSLIPGLALAQGGSLQSLFGNLIVFIGEILIPFLLGMAFLFFTINAIRFFVIESTNEDGRDKAKALAIYSISAFVVLVIFWGMVNLLYNSLGIDNINRQPCPDYLRIMGACHDTIIPSCLDPYAGGAC